MSHTPQPWQIRRPRRWGGSKADGSSVGNLWQYETAAVASPPEGGRWVTVVSRVPVAEESAHRSLPARPSQITRLQIPTDLHGGAEVEVAVAGLRVRKRCQRGKATRTVTSYRIHIAKTNTRSMIAFFPWKKGKKGVGTLSSTTVLY